MSAPRSLPVAVLAAAVLVAGALLVRPEAGPRPAEARAADAADQPGALVPFLRFRGSGSVDVRPDRAELTVGATARGRSSRAALTEASAKARRVAARLRQLGVADADLQTSEATTYQDWERRDWHASVSLRVRVREVDRAGALLAAANEAGADTVSGPAFSVEDRRTTYAEALRRAVDDARSRAEAAAAQMGVRITGVVSVDDAGGGMPPVMMDAAAGGAERSESVPVEPGTQAVMAEVAVVFAYAR